MRTRNLLPDTGDEAPEKAAAPDTQGAMGNLQVKNVPDALHDRLRERVAEEGCALSDFVLRSVERELERGA